MRLSVIVPIYNAVEDIRTSLDSVLEQSVEGGMEVIAIDDGSTDGSGALLDRIAADDPRLRVIHQENAGITRALIAGCEAATGDFLARHDAGDFSLQGRFAGQLACFEADPSLAFVSCWTEYRSPEGAQLFIEKGDPRLVVPMTIVEERLDDVFAGPTSHGSVMFPAAAYQAVGGYRRQFYFAQDWDLWYRLAQHGRFQIAQQVLFAATVFPGGISGVNRDAQMRSKDIARELFRARVARRDEEPLLARAAEIRPVRGRPSRATRAAGLYFVGEALRRRHDRLCRRYFVRTLWLNPFHWKAWIRLLQSFSV